MGGADLAGVTRDGTRWELTFEGSEKFRLTANHLRDVVKLLAAHIDLLADVPTSETQQK